MTMTNREIIPLTSAQLKALTGNLNPNRVKNRKQGSKTLSYLEAWDIRTALIRIFGFGEWSEENISSTVESIERDVPKAGGGTTNFRVTMKCTVRLTIHQTGAVYTGVASASQSGADLGDVMDFALKTADSDAFKRAAMNLGTQFGLSLYDNGSKADVVKVVFAPTQLMGLAATPANVKEAEEAVAASVLTPEQQKVAEDLVARGLQMANDRDNARTPEEQVTTVAETEAPEEPAEEPATEPAAATS